MRSLQGRTLVARSQEFFGSLPMAVALISGLLFADDNIIFAAALLALLILGGFLLAVPLYFFKKEEMANRWYRAAYWMGWVVSVALGALILGAIVAWVINGPTSGGVPFVSAVLFFIARIGFFVDAALIMILSSIGWLAQGNKETNDLARSWARTRAAPPVSPVQEHPTAE